MVAILITMTFKYHDMAILLPISTCKYNCTSNFLLENRNTSVQLICDVTVGVTVGARGAAEPAALLSVLRALGANLHLYYTSTTRYTWGSCSLPT